MASEVHVKGLAELQRMLDTLPAKIEKNIMSGALRAGARVILKVAKGYIHNRSGALAASLRVRTFLEKGKVIAKVIAGGRSRLGEVLYAQWVEYGTRPHYISVKESDKPINPRASARAGHLVRVSMTTLNRNALKIGTTYASAVHHPGSKPHPYLRPALDATSTSALVAVGEYVKKRLTKEGLNTSNVSIRSDE